MLEWNTPTLPGAGAALARLLIHETFLTNRQAVTWECNDADIQTPLNQRNHKGTASITQNPCHMRHTERHNTQFHQSIFNDSQNTHGKNFSLCSPRTERMVLLWLLNSYCFDHYNTKRKPFRSKNGHYVILPFGVWYSTDCQYQVIIQGTQMKKWWI